jgi:hypothetical protein
MKQSQQACTFVVAGGLVPLSWNLFFLLSVDSSEIA